MGNANHPKPPTPTPIGNVTSYINVSPPSATSVLTIDDGQVINSCGSRPEFTFGSGKQGWGGWLTVSADGFTSQTIRVSCVIPILLREDGSPANVGLSPFIPPVPPLPPKPTREQVCGINIDFMGGVIVESGKYGKMPWYPPALSWCDQSTRELAYYATRDKTHQIIEVPNGLPLYDEGNQFYSPDKFGALDWTNGETQLDSRFIDLVREVIQNNFRYIVAMDERVDHSTRIVQLVMQELAKAGLEEYGEVIPGYDSVFYGWKAEQIAEWAALARGIAPKCYLGIEHNVGHIPVGNGPSDYSPNGLMKDYDSVLGEFGENGNIHLDSTWQILGRMIRPYHRPPDQPDGDDPLPPFYLTDSSRGPRYYCTFETDNPYGWVRVDMNNQAAIDNSIKQINDDRAYLRSCGSKYLG